jgi:hypothetical protein
VGRCRRFDPLSRVLFSEFVNASCCFTAVLTERSEPCEYVILVGQIVVLSDGFSFSGISHLKVLAVICDAYIDISYKETWILGRSEGAWQKTVVAVGARETREDLVSEANEISSELALT